MVYSPNLKFDDNENCALPFEIPYEVFEYVAEKTVTTVGLQFVTNSDEGTATVVGYTNDSETDVIIPSYITSGNTAYKVTALSAEAFAGKPVRSVILSDFIDEIPAGAFKNCSDLEEISGSFTIIGDEAFSGCSSLEGFKVSTYTTEIGTEAFLGVPSVSVIALSGERAMELARINLGEDAEEKKLLQEAQNLTNKLVNEAVASGAQKMTLDISNTINGTVFSLDVGDMSSFELLGDKKAVYKDFRIKSEAETTILRNLTIDECIRIPLEIASENLVMEVVKVTSPGYALLLSGEAPTITLIRDNSLKSTKNAVVCKCPSIVSEIVQQAVGTLVVSGNVYVYGTDDQIQALRDSDYLSVTNGEIIPISETEYSQYIKGSFTIKFDANGGNVDVTSQMAFCGNPVGDLPVPEREGFDFAGWYTEDDVLVTGDSAINAVGDITLTAKWNPKPYELSWNMEVGYTVMVNRAESPYADAEPGELSNGATIYYGDVLSVSYTAATGFTITEEGSTSVTVTGNVGASEIYAVAVANAYTVSWNAGEGYTVEVTRTSSPYKGATMGVLNNGDTVYYGDTLHITYGVKDGYTMFENGSNSVTVTGDVTSNEIYADVTANSYTYNIVYKSSNGTSLGSTTATNKFGTTHTISAPGKSGYNTPGSQTVTWDSTSAKTITFVYSPTSVSNRTVTSGTWTSWTSGRHGVSYSVRVEYGQRTASGVQMRVVWTNTVFTTASYIQYGYGQYFTAVIGGQSTGSVQIASASTFSYTYDGVSSTGTSGWITVPVSATSTSTSISLSWNDQDGISGSWSGSIPVPTY